LPIRPWPDVALLCTLAAQARARAWSFGRISPFPPLPSPAQTRPATGRPLVPTGHPGTSKGDGGNRWSGRAPSPATGESLLTLSSPRSPHRFLPLRANETIAFFTGSPRTPPTSNHGPISVCRETPPVLPPLASCVADRRSHHRIGHHPAQQAAALHPAPTACLAETASHLPSIAASLSAASSQQRQRPHRRHRQHRNCQKRPTPRRHPRASGRARLLRCCQASAPGPAVAVPSPCSDRVGPAFCRPRPPGSGLAPAPTRLPCLAGTAQGPKTRPQPRLHPSREAARASNTL
jgi:hypothetical protein